MHGSFKNVDYESYTEYTEYVIMCSWMPRNHNSQQKSWLVYKSFKEIKDMHKKLRKRLQPVIPGGDTYPEFPRKRDAKVHKDPKEQRKARLSSLQTFFIRLAQLFKRAPKIVEHVDELDLFLGLTEKVATLKREKLMQAEDALAASPLSKEELEIASDLINQLYRLVLHSQTNILNDPNIQQLLQACHDLIPRLQASVEVGPFTNIDLIPYAEQVLFSIQEAVSMYNDMVVQSILVG